MENDKIKVWFRVDVTVYGFPSVIKKIKGGDEEAAKAALLGKGTCVYATGAYIPGTNGCNPFDDTEQDVNADATVYANCVAKSDSCVDMTVGLTVYADEKTARELCFGNTNLLGRILSGDFADADAYWDGDSYTDDSSPNADFDFTPFNVRTGDPMPN